MFANRYTVVLDACVLAPAANRNLVLSLAEAKFFRPRWSERILIEAESAIEKMIQKRVPESTDASARAAKAVAAMQKAFPESCVDDGYKMYEGGLDLPDEGDRHVLAATIVTDNLKHFPHDKLSPHGLEAKSADDFIADEIDLDVVKAVGVVKRMRARLNRPVISASEFLLRMEARGLVETTRLLRPYEDLI